MKFELPDAGIIVMEDAETGEQLLVVDSSDDEFRHRLREAGEHREAELRAATAPRRRGHLRGLDRRRPRHRLRPHRRVAEAASRLMSLDSPWMLLCLALVPVLVLAYVRLVRRRSRRADRLAAEGLVPTSASRRGLRWRRHVPFALFAVGARPRLRRARPADDELRAARNGRAR